MSHHNHHDEQRREERNKQRINMNKVWLWIGVIVLCAILFFWIFDIGTFLGPNQ